MRWLKRIGRKIWNRIIRPFGNRKMKIGATIDRWYEDTLKGIEDKVGPDVSNGDEIDKLCLCTIKTSNQYCSAVLHLLNKGYEFPARALMRCLGELNVRFTWCLVCNDTNNNSEAIKIRIHRWQKFAYLEGIKLLEKSKSVMRPQDKEVHEKILEEKKQHYDELQVKNMPDFTEICRQLSEHSDIYDKIRPAFYSVFNNAVHLDPASMAKIYFSQKQGQNSTQLYCFASAYNINFLVRSKYELSIQKIQDEFVQLMNL